ncbi:MAG: DUF4157 domain-containing protein [Deltaproteobacteria bacterium]|nr:DUF4157 domain-containing protein [Deltaproteobacteria bacterium]
MQPTESAQALIAATATGCARPGRAYAPFAARYRELLIAGVLAMLSGCGDLVEEPLPTAHPTTKGENLQQSTRAICATPMAVLHLVLTTTFADHRYRLSAEEKQLFRPMYGDLVDSVRVYRDIPSARIFGMGGLTLGDSIFIYVGPEHEHWTHYLGHELVHVKQTRCLFGLPAFAWLYCGEALLAKGRRSEMSLEQRAIDLADTYPSRTTAVRCSEVL